MSEKREIVIDPITRLEGHGKITIFLDEKGNVQRAYFQIPELRGFEIFCIGREAEDMPIITPRICGVCPSAHHMASTKATDDLYKVDPPPAAKKIRELFYNLFMCEDHLLHIYILAGPDFLVGPKAPKEERNVIGIIKRFKDVALKLIKVRKDIRDAMQMLGGKPVHPVLGVPGGVTKPVTEEERKKLVEVGKETLDFALLTHKIFKDLMEKNEDVRKLMFSDAYRQETYYMGLVDDKNRVNFYDGKIRVVDPKGNEHAKFDVHDYTEYIAEHVEPWTYVRMPFLRKVGWKGLKDGPDSGIYCVAPLARLNAADGMATPKAQEAYEDMYKMYGERPIHYTMAFHWARIVETIYGAERIIELAEDPEITDPNVRTLPTETPSVGIAVVEAPRGTLIHHYEADERGVIKKVNLIVATQQNNARICLDIDRAAKAFIKEGKVDEGILNMIEMAFRAYDPCHACATHSVPGTIPLVIEIRDSKGKLVKVLKNT
ncbi:Ni/Fe hydrogenase subunit alpha [Candidatus Geothermarchaeota archaeon ex4572_27]|nr:MAG: Ni/Fe hydrogenase subunit alpha [Candidatus Geothermarchaeota archaeon ex4572_27]